MLLIDPETGSVIDANAAACRFYGYSMRELLSKNTADIMQSPGGDIGNTFQAALSEKQKYFVLKHRLSSGELRDVEVYRMPLPLRAAWSFFP